MTKPLTAQQAVFARLVGEGKSQSDAYRQAYPKSQKWKTTAVNVAGAKLMAIGIVSETVADYRNKIAEKSLITQESVISELSRIAFFDIRKLFNPDGSLKRVHELDDDTAAAIASIEVVDIKGDGQMVISKKFKTAEKLKALDLIGTHLGMFVRKVEDVTDPLKRAMGNMTPEKAMEMLDALDKVQAIQDRAKAS
jgi:hypothetical protein